MLKSCQSEFGSRKYLLSVRFKDLPRFGGHLKIGAIMRWEVFHDEEEIPTI
jgi:hypothetical protein